MKKTLLIISLLAGATSLVAQGLVNLQSYNVGAKGYIITIYSEDYNHPGEGEIRGNSGDDLPSGNTVYANENPLGWLGFD